MAGIDQNQLTSSLMALGAERLTLVGKHSQILMQAYVQGEIDESELTERQLKKLVTANLIYQPEPTKGFVLRPQMSDLVASIVADESRRHVNADVADRMETIRMRVHTYREAHRVGDTARSDQQLRLLAEHVHDLSGQFGEAIDSLWHRLNSNFGFVRSLSDKIRENDRAQKQIRRLLDGLNVLDFSELIELAEGSVQLRKLLVSQLQRQHGVHHAALLEVQKRLVHLMMRFREQQARSVLIANMTGFLRENPSFQVADYAFRAKVPDLINQAPAIIPAAAVGLDDHSSKQLAAELLHSLPRIISPDDQAEPERAVAVKAIENDLAKTRPRDISADVERFMLAVVESSELSALDYLHSKSLQWDAEVWLFQVLGEFQALNKTQRDLFNLVRHEAPAHRFNNLYLVQDLTLQFAT